MKPASSGLSSRRGPDRRSAALGALGGLLLAAGVFIALALPARFAEAAQTLHSADFVLGDSALPPPPDAPWRPQSLPDWWAKSRPDSLQTSGWYRLRFDVPQSAAGPQAVYIPRIRPAAEVYVNQMLIGRTALPDRPQRNVHPQYLAIPPAALHAGTNELYVHMQGKGPHGLAAVTVGEDVAVRPLYESRYFWQVTGVQFCSVFAAVWGIFSLLLWLRQRADRMYLYFGLSALCWVIYTSSGYMRFPPLPSPWWDALYALAALGKLFMLALFAACYAGSARPSVERGLWAAYAVTMGIVWAGTFNLDPWIGGFDWNYVIFPVLGGYVAVFVVLAWRQPSWESALLALAASIHLVDGFYHYVLEHPFGQLPLDYYDFLPLNVVLVWILIDRFIGALDEAKRLNVELEGRVARKHAELQRNFIQLREMERKQTIAEERQRIMSDMHDGIGGQLISTLSLVEQGSLSSAEVAAVLRESIEDLRLTIDSLEPTDNDLLAVLSNLRYRIEGRLKRCGIELDWQVKDVPKLACLTPQNVLHILRILQEAFTNVLKHAQATLIRVETGIDGDGKVVIRVCDNGKGFAPSRKGHGLDNMKRRARTIGGDVGVHPSPSGTTLALMLPVG
jgi:signal transduction histidine kinase